MKQTKDIDEIKECIVKPLYPDQLSAILATYECSGSFKWQLFEITNE